METIAILLFLRYTRHENLRCIENIALPVSFLLTITVLEGGMLEGSPNANFYPIAFRHNIMDSVELVITKEFDIDP